jgi:hypothetical protein
MEQSFRSGGLSIYGWAEGLRACHERRMPSIVVAFYELVSSLPYIHDGVRLTSLQLTDAYHHFLNTKTEMDTKVSETLNTMDDTDWMDQNLMNLCPPCFAFKSSSSLDRTIILSIDGNLQHSRFKDTHRWEFDVIKPKMFVDYGRREFSLAMKETPSGCGSHFKATKGWSRSLTQTATKKGLDETGLIVATCFHGIPLRFLNMHGTGERHSHAEAVLLSIFKELEDLGQIHLCYDVACIFEEAIQKSLPDYEERIRVRIGRFHVYAHGLSCQILFSTLRTAGFGLVVGEEPEHIWYQLSPLVRSGRVSTGPRRTQKIDVTAQHIAKRYRECLGTNIQRRWAKKNNLEMESRAILREMYTRLLPQRIDKTGRAHAEQQITPEYLQAQIDDQLSYYQNYNKPVGRDTDDLFEALLDEERLSQEFANEMWLQAERQRIASSGVRRGRGRPRKLIPPANLAALTREQMKNFSIRGLDAVEKTDELIEKHQTSYEEFRKDGNLVRS